MSTRAQFQESIEMLRVDVDALGLMAQQAVDGALGALVGGDRSVAERVLAGDDRIDAFFVALDLRPGRPAGARGRRPPLPDVVASGHGGLRENG